MDDARERLTAIYDTHRMRVWAYVVSRAGRDVADDVVSETFTVAWRRLGDVPDDPVPWLLAVARNLLRDRYRAQTRREALERELALWVHPSAPDAAETAIDRTAMLRALVSLTDADREILILTSWQGLTTSEAAQVVGVSDIAMRVRLHRARNRLADAIADQTALGAASLMLKEFGS